MKDPAFLFYASDFLTGTMFMDFEQRGKYIYLLCAQHQHLGYIDKKSFNLIVGNDDILRSKFTESEHGFYNKRLEIEIIKRKKDADSSRNNGKLGGRPTNKPKQNPQVKNKKPKHNLTVNENEDINEIEDIIKNEIAPDVLLTSNEIKKLKDKFTVGYQWALETLSNYKLSSGKKYKSDYHALIGWVHEKYLKLNLEHQNKINNGTIKQPRINPFFEELRAKFGDKKPAEQG